MRKNRRPVHSLLGSTIQKFMVAPIVDLLRLHDGRK